MMCVVFAIRAEKVSESRPRVGSASLPARHSIFGEVMRCVRECFFSADWRREDAASALVALIRQ